MSKFVRNKDYKSFQRFLLHTLYIIIIILYKSANFTQNCNDIKQEYIQEFVQGRGLIFFLGGLSPIGVQKPPENPRFHCSRGGWAPKAPIAPPPPREYFSESRDKTTLIENSTEKTIKKSGCEYV